MVERLKAKRAALVADCEKLSAKIALLDEIIAEETATTETVEIFADSAVVAEIAVEETTVESVNA